MLNDTGMILEDLYSPFLGSCIVQTMVPDNYITCELYVMLNVM